MILTDTGPLVALLDADDPYHVECVAALHRLPLRPLLTTWVCLTEAMYLLGEVGGYRYQAALWNLRATGRLAESLPDVAQEAHLTSLTSCRRPPP